MDDADSAIGFDIGGGAELSTENHDKLVIKGHILAETAAPGLSNPSDILPHAKPPQVRTWNLEGEPVSGMKLLAGSLSVSGLAARIYRPVPAQPALFQLPYAAANDSLVNRSETLNTRRSAFECLSGNIRTMMLFDSDSGISGSFPAVTAAASALFGQRSSQTLETTVIAASGTAAPGSSDTWFPEHTPLPARTISIFGTETRGQINAFRGSGAALLSVDSIGSTAVWGSIDTGADLPWIGGAAGILAMDRNFSALDGSLPGTLTRAYAAPYISILPIFPSFDTFRAGGAYTLKRIRRERAWENDTFQAESRAALEIGKNGFHFFLEGRQTDAERGLQAKIRFPLWRARSAKAEMQVTAEENLGGGTAEYTASAAVSASPFKAFTIGLSSECAFYSSPEPEESAAGMIGAAFALGLGKNSALTGAFSRKLTPDNPETTLEMTFKLSLSSH